MTYNEFIEIAAHFESVIKATKADILPIRSNSFVEFFDLINRQKAEIERYLHSIKLLEKDVQTANAEIERLKFRKCLYSGLYSEYDIKQIRDCTQGECFHRESEELVRIEAIKWFKKLVSRRFNCNTPRGAYLLNIMNEVEKEMVGDDNA